MGEKVIPINMCICVLTETRSYVAQCLFPCNGSLYLKHHKHLLELYYTILYPFTISFCFGRNGGLLTPPNDATKRKLYWYTEGLMTRLLIAVAWRNQ